MDDHVMKILQIVNSGYEEGGVESGVVLTNELLQQNGHEVKTITSNVRPDLPHFSDYEFSELPKTGIKKIIYGTFNFNAYRVTRAVLSDFQPDVVLLHTMSYATGAVLFLLKRFPAVLFVHGPEIYTKTLLPWCMPKNAYRRLSYQVRDLNWSGRLRYYYLKYVSAFVYRVGMRNVNQMVALSTYTLRFLRDEGYQAMYIPNGVKLMDSAPLQVKEPRLLYVGRLEKFKGVDDLIQAMPTILSKFPTANLLIVGDGTYSDELKALVIGLGLEQSIEFLGRVPHNQTASYYRKCTILVMPSTWPETFGKVGIEAMSVGRPVIATDVGGVRDWIMDGGNGFLIEPNQPSQIANKAIELLSDEQVANNMSKLAQETARQFSMEQFTRSIETLIDQVCPKA
jgi:glycosyltransferase involved in cell wall biosynthesis